MTGCKNVAMNTRKKLMVGETFLNVNIIERNVAQIIQDTPCGLRDPKTGKYHPALVGDIIVK